MALRNERLTGRVRFTVISRFFEPDVLALEVEVSHSDGPLDSDLLPTYLANTCWRLGRTEDLTELRIHASPNR